MAETRRDRFQYWDVQVETDLVLPSLRRNTREAVVVFFYIRLAVDIYIFFILCCAITRMPRVFAGCFNSIDRANRMMTDKKCRIWVHLCRRVGVCNTYRDDMFFPFWTWHFLGLGHLSIVVKDVHRIHLCRKFVPNLHAQFLRVRR